MRSAGDFGVDRGHRIGATCRAIADADRRTGRTNQVDGIAVHDIAIGDELYAGDIDCPLAVIDSDCSFFACKYSECGILEWRIDVACFGPVIIAIVGSRAESLPDTVTAFDFAIVLVLRIGSIPEAQCKTRRIDQIDLLCNRGLDIEIR